MKCSLLVASVLLTISSASIAVPQTVSGTEEFKGGLAGYGFKYSVTWDAPVAYELLVTNYSVEFQIGGEVAAAVAAGWSLLPSASSDFSGLSALDINVTASMAFINLQTGESELPASVYRSISTDTVYEFGRILREPCTSPAGGVELRFSNPQCSFVSAISRSAERVGGGMAAAADGSARFVVRSGNYLSASDDPECASFSCMTPGRDLIGRNGVSFVAVAGQIPEPNTWLMLISGLIAMPLVARRAGQSRSAHKKTARPIGFVAVVQSHK